MIGLTDEITEMKYQWVTDEPYSYSNWDVNQPDNHNGNEHYVEFLESSDKWNDLPNTDTDITGYIIEFTTPDFVPTENLENGHYYQYVTDYGISWTYANHAAQTSI